MSGQYPEGWVMHRPVPTTDIYSHFLKRADEAASDALESLLNPPDLGQHLVNKVT